jgi:hypothetical protein
MDIISNTYNLLGNLVPNEGLGVFVILSPQRPIVTQIQPKFAILKAKREVSQTSDFYSDLDDAKVVISESLNENDIIISLDIKYRLELLKLSILTLSDQAHRYQSSDYLPLIISQIDDSQNHLLRHGPAQMKDEVSSKIRETCSALLTAISERGLDGFYEEHSSILKRISPDFAEEFRNSFSQDEFIKAAISQHISKDEQGSCPTTLLVARWLRPILIALWREDIIYYADKSPKLQRNVGNMVLKVGSTSLDIVGAEPPIVEFEQDRVWLDFNGGLTAGLTPKVVNSVLKLHNQSIIIDLLKLFATLWCESPQIQRSHSYNIPNRWDGLTQLLHERYGNAIGGRNTERVINGCRLLEALRWGKRWDDHDKLLIFSGRKRNQELFVSYQSGFWGPMMRHERLVPILNHPKGGNRSRALYNRFGLALGCWLLDHCYTYHHSGGLGVAFDDDAYSYFREHVGFKRKSDVDKALDAFENFGAITRPNGLLGLGEKNTEGKRMILEGTEASITGRRGGLKSKRRKNKLLF